MVSKVEIGFGIAAAASLAGAADSWLGTGAVDLLVDLCLSDTGAARPEAAGMTMPAAAHGAHTSLFLAASLAFVGAGLCWERIAALAKARDQAPPQGRARRRLIVATVHVARACKGTSPSVVAEAFRTATGEGLEPGEIASAVNFLRSGSAFSIERLLSGARDDEEKRRILSSATDVWARFGMDSSRATRAMEEVAAGLRLQDEEIAAALDPSWTEDATRVLRQVEIAAWRTVSRAGSEARRITSKVLNIG